MSAYSFLDVSVTLVGPGVDIDMGYGASVAEEGIDFVPVEAKNTMTIGIDGKPMHSLHANKARLCTVRLLQTSPVNAQLMAAYDAQSLTSSLWGQNVIEARQTAAGDSTTARDVAFNMAATIPYKKVGQFMEWKFDCGTVDSVLGTY